jgi:hypothetical protein
MNSLANKYRGHLPIIENPNKDGTLTLFNLQMSQNQNTFAAYSNLFNHLIKNNEKIGRIIEIGTARGGLSILFKLFCIVQKCDFITYDIIHDTIYSDIFKILSIDYRIIDCFNPNSRIEEEIKKEDISIVFCDAGNKNLEVNTFSNDLKSGDIILAHDFIDESREDAYKYWPCKEAYPSAIKLALEKNNIQPFFYEDFYKSATFCGRKI